jgi:hypothetical protein
MPASGLVARRFASTDWLQLHKTILTLIAAIAQLVALLWYMISYFPMGTTGLRYASSFAGNRIAAWMND